MQPEYSRHAAETMLRTLQPVVSADWSTRAGGLDWDCRTTMEHVGHALDRYSLYLAGPDTNRLPFQLVSHPECTPADLLHIVELRAAVLCQVARAASPETRGYHTFGRSDRDGYVAMGCIEMLVHTDDVARGMGLEYDPPADLVRQVLARLFPWAPADTDPWQTLQWATGRVDLPGHPRVGADWAWHASPVSEWDGAVKTQASYR